MQQTQVLAGYREVSSRQRFYRLPNCKVSSVLIQWENPSCWHHGQETVWQNQHDPNAKHPASHHPSFRTKTTATTTTTTHQISFKDTTRRNDTWQMTLQARLHSYRTNNWWISWLTGQSVSGVNIFSSATSTLFHVKASFNWSNLLAPLPSKSVLQTQALFMESTLQAPWAMRTQEKLCVSKAIFFWQRLTP